MDVFKNLLKKTKKIQPNRLTEDLFNFLESIEETILDINREQLLNSTDSKGKSLFSKQRKRGTYTKATEIFSGGSKVAGTRYTLKDTGDFFKGFFLEIRQDEALFGSKDNKTLLLLDDYGDIFGLTPKNLSKLIQDKVKPFLIQHIRTTFDL